MPKLLIFQHVAHELLGTLHPLLRNHGFRNHYINFGRDPHAEPSLDGYHGIVVLGGPMNVDQVDAFPHLKTEVRLLKQAIASEMPVLGICLGAQLLAKALGAQVRPNGEKEIGWYDVEPTTAGREDPLFAHFETREKIFQWHSDTFEIPEGAVHLATSPACSNQAFRFGANAYGFQFHLEVDPPMIERWLDVPGHREEIAAEQGRICPEQIRRDTEAHGKRLRELSDPCFSGFIEHFGSLRRRGDGPHS
ncbi:MAG TPA: type 1 glutamine amidotransferase [Myxococcales bacterium]|nr:type 1 glutamine amidotransferase [Myxococcales bacterium]HIM01366.1 type 1 glutamine amidotransferase [Myxococcales bacterium]